MLDYQYDCTCVNVYLIDDVYKQHYCIIVVFFFFKQKTAYEMLRSLVGSEMCIRDRAKQIGGFLTDEEWFDEFFSTMFLFSPKSNLSTDPVSYTHLTLPTIYSV